MLRSLGTEGSLSLSGHIRAIGYTSIVVYIIVTGPIKVTGHITVTEHIRVLGKPYIKVIRAHKGQWTKPGSLATSGPIDISGF